MAVSKATRHAGQPGLLGALARDTRAVASIEFACAISIISIALLYGADGAYFYAHRLQVESAAQMGAYAGSRACDNTQLPAVSNCPGLASAVSAGVKSTSLGTAVTVQSGYPSEGYYCLSTAGALQLVGDVSSNPPADCTASGRPTEQPGDYLVVRTQYTHKPIFGTSFASLIPTAVSGSAMVRLK